MQISAQKAIDNGFVCDRNNKKIKVDHSHKSSVDLTIREILFKDENGVVKSRDWAALKPQDSVLIISEEILHVPEGYIAYVFLKNRLSQKGFLALNTGIIDSNYNGPISTLLINFSGEEENLPMSNDLVDKVFFRIVFHEIEKPVNPQPPSTAPKVYKVKEKYDSYRSYRFLELSKFPKTFLEPKVLKEQINRELTEKLTGLSLTRIGLMVTIVGLVISLVPVGRDYYFADKYDLKEFYQYKIESEQKINNLQEQLNKIQERVGTQEKSTKTNKINNR